MLDRNSHSRENGLLEEEDSEVFDEDIRLMEGLIQNPLMRDKRLLAVLDHDAPVNCVRWNNVGTLFASAGDDMQIFIWEYQGEEKMSATLKYLNMEREKGDDRVLEEGKTSERSYERWKSVKVLKGH
jgi:WD40 repeat protein